MTIIKTFLCGSSYMIQLPKILNLPMKMGTFNNLKLIRLLIDLMVEEASRNWRNGLTRMCSDCWNIHQSMMMKSNSYFLLLQIKMKKSRSSRSDSKESCRNFIERILKKKGLKNYLRRLWTLWTKTKLSFQITMFSSHKYSSMPPLSEQR